MYVRADKIWNSSSTRTYKGCYPLEAKVVFAVSAMPTKIHSSQQRDNRRRNVRTMMAGFSGWLRMRDTENETVKVVDAAITVVATLMVATTWVVLR